MYSYFISRRLSNGLDIEPDNIRVRDYELYDNYNSLVSSLYYTRMYHVTDLPRSLTRSISYHLKSVLPKGMMLDIITEVVDSPIDWTTPYMQRLKSAWNKELSKHSVRVNENELNDSEVYVKARQSNSAASSWNFLARKTAEGHRTCDAEIVVLVRYPKTWNMKDIVGNEQIWLNSLKNKGIGLTLMKKNIKPLMYDLMPSKTQGTQPIKNYSTWLEENVAYSESYLPGKLDGTQVFLGRDIYTNMFVFSDLLTTRGGALNMMILASTGAGKSFYIKFLTIVLLSLGVNVVIWDKDGEYEALARTLNYPVISLGKNGGAYFNTIPIVSENPDGYEDSKSDTLAIFDVLCDPDEGMTPNEKTIIQRGYTELLRLSGVNQFDQSTWRNSAELDYKDLYRQIKELDSVEDELKTVYKDLLRKLEQYFEPYGLNNTVFVNPININDFLHYKGVNQPLLVTVNMQLDNIDNQVSTNKALDKIKSITMSSITDRLVMYNKLRSELTAVIVEEFQRQTTNKMFVDKVHTAVTGGRKQNMIPILVLNALNSMVESDNPKLKDILDNINTLIVGAVKETSRELAVKYANLDYCEEILTKIFQASEQKNSSNYKNSFLVRIKSDERTELAVVKAFVPPDLRDTVFKTRSGDE